MAHFYYDPNKDPLTQWLDHLQAESYLAKNANNMEFAIKSFAQELQYSMQSISDAERFIMSDTINVVMGSVDTVTGFVNTMANSMGEVSETLDILQSEVMYGFEEISKTIRHILHASKSTTHTMAKMLSTVEWNMSILGEGQRLTNVLTQNIAEILKIPEFQKERLYYTQNGLKFLNNARINSALYKDALNNLLKAEAIEPTDYFILHKIGLIYLYAENCVDLKKAEHYFGKAAKYAEVETSPEAVILEDLLQQDAYKTGSNYLDETDIKRIAKESYYQGALACYAQGKIREAAEFSQKAWFLDQSFTEAGFLAVKAFCARDQADAAVDILLDVVEQDKNYIIKAMTDKDICTKKPIQKVFKSWRDRQVLLARIHLTIAKAPRACFQDDSIVDPYFEEISNHIKKNTLFDAELVFKKLTQAKTWDFDLRTVIGFEEKGRYRLASTISSVSYSVDKIMVVGEAYLKIFHAYTGISILEKDGLRDPILSSGGKIVSFTNLNTKRRRIDGKHPREIYDIRFLATKIGDDEAFMYIDEVEYNHNHSGIIFYGSDGYLYMDCETNRTYPARRYSDGFSNRNVFSPKHDNAVFTAKENTVILLDLISNSQVIPHHLCTEEPATFISVCPDENLIFVYDAPESGGTRTGNIYIWQWNANDLYVKSKFTCRSEIKLQWVRRASRLIVLDEINNCLMFWDFGDRTISKLLDLDDDFIEFGVSDDSQALLICYKNKVSIHDIYTGAVIGETNFGDGTELQGLVSCEGYCLVYTNQDVILLKPILGTVQTQIKRAILDMIFIESTNLRILNYE